jgi:hypothetical protein
MSQPLPVAHRSGQLAYPKLAYPKLAYPKKKVWGGGRKTSSLLKQRDGSYERVTRE